MKCKYETTGWYEGMKRCLGTKEVDPCPGYDKCENYKPNYMTNGDRIRSMTDEELVGFLTISGICERIVTDDDYWCAKQQNDCERCARAWLRQPYEEGRSGVDAASALNVRIGEK